MRAAKGKRLRWWVMLPGIVGIVCLGLLLAHRGWERLMQPIIVTLVSLPYIVWLKWDMRSEVWFRLVMAIMVSVHVMLLALVPWTYRDLPGRAVGGAFVLDACFMLAVIDGVGVFLQGRKKVSGGRHGISVTALGKDDHAS